MKTLISIILTIVVTLLLPFVLLFCALMDFPIAFAKGELREYVKAYSEIPTDIQEIYQACWK